MRAMEAGARKQPTPRPPGAILRALRLKNGWTLSQLSQRTGLTVSTLSKVENGKMSLTYDKMMRIATGLGIDIGVLFASADEAPAAPPAAASGRRSVTRRGEGRVIETRNFIQLYPAAELLKKQIVPIIVEVKARSRDDYGPLLSHAGEEYVLVLDGAIELHTEFYAPALLNAGDSIYFDSSMPHGYVAAARGPCRMLSVCSTAEWGAAAGGRTDIERSVAEVGLRVIRSK